MAYDREKAATYAKTYWNTACDDGIYYTAWGKVSVSQKRQQFKIPANWVFRFQPDPTRGENAVFLKDDDISCYTYDCRIVVTPWLEAYKAPDGTTHEGGLDDCTHFVSRCLLSGGAIIKETAGAANLVTQLKHNSSTCMIGEQLHASQGQKIIDSNVLQTGDIISYFERKSGQYHHNAMYMGLSDGSGRITCHTVCRFPGKSDQEGNKWHLGRTDSSELLFTFFHFTNEVPGAGQQVSSPLAGWWKIEVPPTRSILAWTKNGGSKDSGVAAYYQYNYGTGISYKTSTAPSGPSAKPGHNMKGHWFKQTGGYVFVWQSNGDVDLWTSPSGDSCKIIINGIGNGTATRIRKEQ
jgi:hypothetical protein